MRNFKKVAIILAFVLVCCLINAALDYVLIPNTYMRIKMHNIETKSYDDLILGASHGFDAINPTIVDSVTGRESTNLCIGGEYVRDSYYLLKDACRKGKPKRVIYELDPSYWVTKNVDNIDFTLAYNNMTYSLPKLEYFFAKATSADFREILFPWFNYRNQYASIRTNVQSKQGEAYKNYETAPLESPVQALREEGFLYVKQSVEPKAISISLWDETKVLDDVLKYFDKMVTYCKKNEIELVVITTPVPQETLDMYPDNYKNAYDYFCNLMSEYGISYYNFNYLNLHNFDRSINGYIDYDGHMLGENANAFSEILGECLKEAH